MAMVRTSAPLLALSVAMCSCAVERGALGRTRGQDASSRDASVDASDAAHDTSSRDATGTDPNEDVLCVLLVETCNGLDDDCDGTPDDFDETCDTGEEGVCRMGTRHCTDGAWNECRRVSEPTDEICDSFDNDCNGTVDDIGGACSTGMLGECATGVETCDGCTAPTPAPSEICDNGLDDDCNGMTDEGCDCTTRSAPISGRDYRFCRTARTWDEARAGCESVGMQLLRINDTGENTYVQGVLNLDVDVGAANSWWIGLRDVQPGGSPDRAHFRWYPDTITASEPSFTSWGASDPDLSDSCAVVGPFSRVWLDRNCSDTYRYICEES